MYLAEIVAYTGAGTETLRYASGSFVTASGDTPANTWFDPRMKQSVDIRRDIFSGGRTDGRSRTGHGELVLANDDGGLDALEAYGFDGRAITIYRGVGTEAFPGGWTKVLVGTIANISLTPKEVRFRLRDRKLLTNIPLQTTKYAGDNSLPNGLEGVAGDLKGKPKPVLYGVVQNATPPLVNTSKLIYQIADATLNSVDAVYDRGVALTDGGSYASEANLLDDSLEPDPGEFKYYLVGGYFRLGSSPAGTITADATEGANAAARTAAQIFKRVLEARAGMSGSDYSSGDLTTLDAAAPYVCGVWEDREVWVADAIDRIAGSVGAWWGTDNPGLFRIKQLLAPTGTAALEIGPNDLLKPLLRVPPKHGADGLPPYRTVVRYSRNYTVQETDFVDPALIVRGRVTSTSATEVIVRVAVADPFPQGTDTATVAYQDEGSGGVSPGSGGTVTPEPTITEAANTYIDFTITRPAFTAGTGRVTFTVTASDREAAVAAIDVPAQEKTSFGPSLTVTPTPGNPNYSIAWSGSGTITVSVNGAGYGTPAVSPIAVARGAEGTTGITYAFRAVLDGQTIDNTITVPPIGADTTTPDLELVPGTVTPTLVPFTITGSNPSGGAAPELTATPFNCTMTISGVAYTSETTIGSGTIIVVDRPAFSSNQATLTGKASISGGGLETISRTILNQDKVSFGPSLIVTPTPGNPNYSLAWSGSGTITVSIDGAGYGAPAATPISVARGAEGTDGVVYSFHAVLDGQTIENSVTIPPIGTDTNTVTPDLTVTPGTQTSTTQPFTVTATDPSGANTPVIKVQTEGTTATGSSVGAIADGVLTTIPSGEVVTVARPAFNTVPAMVTFTANLVASSGGAETIQRTVLNQDKGRFGPDLTVTTTPFWRAWSSSANRGR